MNYEAVICVFIEPNKKNGEKKRKKFAENFIIQFQKNHVFRELILKDPKIFTELSRFLRMRCILTTFHEDFTVIKGIGKGSFAKVHTILFCCRFFLKFDKFFIIFSIFW